MGKYSRQNNAIITELKGRYDHPTAEQVYASLKPAMPELSLATVYRNLTKLAKNNTILKIGCRNSPDRFDGNPAPHAHLLCESCGNLFDVDIPIEEVVSLENIHINAHITGFDLILHGICESCLEK